MTHLCHYIASTTSINGWHLSIIICWQTTTSVIRPWNLVLLLHSIWLASRIHSRLCIALKQQLSYILYPPPRGKDIAPGMRSPPWPLGLWARVLTTWGRWRTLAGSFPFSVDTFSITPRHRDTSYTQPDFVRIFLSRTMAQFLMIETSFSNQNPAISQVAKAAFKGSQN